MLPPRCRFVAVPSDLVLPSLPLRLLDIGVARMCAVVLACLSAVAEDFLSLLLHWRIVWPWFRLPVTVWGRRRTVNRRNGRVDVSRCLSSRCRRLGVLASVVVVAAAFLLHSPPGVFVASVPCVSYVAAPPPSAAICGMCGAPPLVVVCASMASVCPIMCAPPSSAAVRVLASSSICC